MTVRGILDDYHFKVPKYQRKYSWSKKEIDAFLEDLKNVHKDNTVKPKKYFFGSMVFEGSVKTTIIDGQQRLATVSLFLASIIEVCHMLQSKKEELSNKYELNYQKFSKHESLIEDARKRLFRNEKEIV